MATHRPPNSRDIELLSAYIDGELSEMERAALEARLDREPMLQQELESLTTVVEAVRSLPPLEAPRNFTLTPEMIAHNERAEKAAASVLIFPISTAFSALSAAAATLLIAFGVMMLLIQNAPFPGGTTADFAAQEPANDSIAAQPTDTNTPAPIFQATVLPALTVTVLPPTPEPTASPTRLPTQPPAPQVAEAELEAAEEAEEQAAEAGDTSMDDAAGLGGAVERANRTETVEVEETASSILADEQDTTTADAFIMEGDTDADAPAPPAADASEMQFITETPRTGETIVIVPPTSTPSPTASPTRLFTAIPGQLVPPRQSSMPTPTAPSADTDAVEARRAVRIDPAQVIAFSSIVVGIALMGVAAMTTITRRRRRGNA